VESIAPTRRYGAIFEDDGQTGYLYGLDLSGGEMQILDALHIYNVARVVDRAAESTVEILWARQWTRAALLINDHAHACFDFAEGRGCCRTGFPPTNRTVGGTHAWDEALWESIAEEGFEST
jgi:hypothetical protein